MDFDVNMMNIQKGYLSTNNFEEKLLEKEIRVGKVENDEEFNLTNIKKNNIEHVITYIGDSVTHGFNSQGVLDENHDGYRGIIDEELKKIRKFKQSYNYAVGGFTINDVHNVLYNNLTINDMNLIMKKRLNLNEKIEAKYPINEKNNINFIEAIKNSTIMVISIGYNDFLPLIGDIWDMEKININFSKLIPTLERIYLQKELFYNLLKEINPNLKIFELDGYVPQTNISSDAMEMLYSLYDYISEKIMVKNLENVHQVELRHNIQSNHLEYIDNPHDAHPNFEGYKVIAGKIMKTIDKYYYE